MDELAKVKSEENFFLFKQVLGDVYECDNEFKHKYKPLSEVRLNSKIETRNSFVFPDNVEQENNILNSELNGKSEFENFSLTSTETEVISLFKGEDEATTTVNMDIKNILTSALNENRNNGTGKVSREEQDEGKIYLLKCRRSNNNQRDRSLASQTKNTKWYNCSHCGKSFDNSGTLKIHLRRHTGEKPFSCSHCSKAFTHKSNLKVHIKMHLGDKSFSCNECPKKFSTLDNLKQHIRMHVGEKPFRCQKCTNSYAYRSSLKLHLRTHSGEKPFVCHFCNNRFSELANVKRHVETHLQRPPFHCEHCDQRFTSESDFVRAHKGKIPFLCGICNRAAFLTHKSLNEHTKEHKKRKGKHVREKTFRYQKCSNSYAYRSSLKLHFPTHTGEEPFSNDICNKRFTEIADVKQHVEPYLQKPVFDHDDSFTSENDFLRAHKGKMPFECGFCNKAFITHKCLNEHTKEHLRKISAQWRQSCD